MRKIIKNKLPLLTTCFLVACLNSYGQYKSTSIHDVYTEATEQINSNREKINVTQIQKVSLKDMNRMKQVKQAVENSDKSTYAQTNYSFVFDRYGSVSLDIKKTEETADGYLVNEEGKFIYHSTLANEKILLTKH